LKPKTWKPCPFSKKTTYLPPKPLANPIDD
jgi:hypothetical protein